MDRIHPIWGGKGARRISSGTETSSELCCREGQAETHPCVRWRAVGCGAASRAGALRSERGSRIGCDATAGHRPDGCPLRNDRPRRCSDSGQRLRSLRLAGGPERADAVGQSRLSGRPDRRSLRPTHDGRRNALPSGGRFGGRRDRRPADSGGAEESGFRAPARCRLPDGLADGPGPAATARAGRSLAGADRRALRTVDEGGGDGLPGRSRSAGRRDGGHPDPR